MISKKTALSLGLIALMIVGFWTGCSSSDSNPPPPQSGGSTPPTVTVHIANGATGTGSAAYGANPLVIAAGTNVIWANDDTVAHTATSDTGVWDTGAIQPGQQSAPVSFTNVGSFPYHCSIHGALSMNGVVQVTASPSPSPSPSRSPLSWSQVTEQQTCPYPLCPAFDGFTVNGSGQYFTGSGNSGNVTRNELRVLDAAASEVALNAGSLGYSCVSQPALPGASSATVDETFADGTTQQIYSYDTSTGQLCFRGSKQNAQALYDRINSLAQQYDIPETPSPSPSSSPSPSPSPSESMTMSPRTLSRVL